MQQHHQRQTEPHSTGTIRQEGEEPKTDPLRLADGFDGHTLGLRRRTLLRLKIKKFRAFLNQNFSSLLLQLEMVADKGRVHLRWQSVLGKRGRQWLSG